MTKFSKLPEKRERYFTIGGSGAPEDYTAIALFETPEGKRDAVIGITLKNIPEVSGFVAFVAGKFGVENGYKVAMIELPMIYWKGGTLEEEVLVTTAVNDWIDNGTDPTEIFYDCLEDLGFESFYSDHKDAVTNQKPIPKHPTKIKNKNGKGFG